MQVNVFLAWALLLSYLHSLPSSSTARERLIQYIQDSVSSTIIDCIFQHVPMKLGASNVKKKDVDNVNKQWKGRFKAFKHCSAASSLEFLIQHVFMHKELTITKNQSLGHKPNSKCF